MSRTYRKRKENSKTHNSEKWVLTDSGFGDEFLRKYDGQYASILICNSFYNSRYGLYYRVQLDPNSIEGKRRLSKYHSDGGTSSFKEPGPSWWKNLTTHRPYRRKYKEECRKCMYDSEYEIILEKITYPYWT